MLSGPKESVAKPDTEITVQPSYFGRVDFSRQLKIATRDLERCVSVIIYGATEKVGLIAHMTAHIRVEPLVDWIAKQGVDQR